MFKLKTQPSLRNLKQLIFTNKVLLFCHCNNVNATHWFAFKKKLSQLAKIQALLVKSKIAKNSTLFALSKSNLAAFLAGLPSFWLKPHSKLLLNTFFSSSSSLVASAAQADDADQRQALCVRLRLRQREVGLTLPSLLFSLTSCNDGSGRLPKAGKRGHDVCFVSKVEDEKSRAYTNLPLEGKREKQTKESLPALGFQDIRLATEQLTKNNLKKEQNLCHQLLRESKKKKEIIKVKILEPLLQGPTILIGCPDEKTATQVAIFVDKVNSNFLIIGGFLDNTVLTHLDISLLKNLDTSIWAELIGVMQNSIVKTFAISQSPAYSLVSICSHLKK